MPSLVATTSALASTTCMRTHYVRTNNVPLYLYRTCIIVIHLMNLCVILFRPVLVTFEDFTDRENVLRKAGMLRGSNIHVTEDMSRYGLVFNEDVMYV